MAEQKKAGSGVYSWGRGIGIWDQGLGKRAFRFPFKPCMIIRTRSGSMVYDPKLINQPSTGRGKHRTLLRKWRENVAPPHDFWI